MTDLIGEGLLGFKNGLKKFDIKRGTRLTTFLYYWIFDAISKAYAQQRYIVSVPKKTQQQIIAVRKVSFSRTFCELNTNSLLDLNE